MEVMVVVRRFLTGPGGPDSNCNDKYIARQTKVLTCARLRVWLGETSEEATQTQTY